MTKTTADSLTYDNIISVNFVAGKLYLTAVEPWRQFSYGLIECYVQDNARVCMVSADDCATFAAVSGVNDCLQMAYDGSSTVFVASGSMLHKNNAP